MGRRTSAPKNNNKPKFVSLAPNTYIDIQPRCVLQRLGKEYTVAAGTGCDNQPSNNGYLKRNQKQSGGVNSATRKRGENKKNIGNNHGVIPSKTDSNQVTNDRDHGVIEFKVAELTEADPGSSTGDESDSDCSYYSTPGELMIIDENNSDNDGRDDEREKSEESNSSKLQLLKKANSKIKTPRVTNIREEYRKILATRSESKVRKATKFLNFLVSTYSKPYDESTTDDGRTSTSPKGQTKRRIIRVPRRPQCNNLKDCIVRMWLPICGEKKKKKFQVRLSQLISLLRQRSHPLHRFCNVLTTRSMNYLTDDEITSLARVLSEFVCAQPVYF